MSDKEKPIHVNEHGDLVQAPIDYKERYDKMVHFIEMTEALTYDPKTALRIREFLKKEGVWK